MPTTQGNRKLLDSKRWEFMNPAPTATLAGSLTAMSRHIRQQALYIASTNNAWLYRPDEDGFIQLPSAGLTPTFSSGSCGCATSFSTGSTVGAATLSATAGTTTTITTNQTLARDLRGWQIHIVSGPNAGVTLTISSNTIGASAVITVPAQGSAFSASTTYRLLTPTWYVLAGTTLASGSFRKYDFATNTWTTLSITGLAATIATDSRLIATPSFIDSAYVSFASGTATAGGASTLTNSGKAWTTNQWTNYQLRITGGTGAGQIRTVASNTGTVITVGAAWTTQPDATSTYSLEGNDDFLYYIGNSAVTMYRYSISGNSWSTLAPSAARAAAPAAGVTGEWVWGATESDWTSESAIRNGQRIYSFRGGTSASLDYYDIAANTWVSAVSYSPAAETFTTGTRSLYVGNHIYIHKDATGRWFRYDVARQEMDGWSQHLYPSGAAVVGNTAFEAVYIDGATSIPYVYTILNTSTVMLRQMVI